MWMGAATAPVTFSSQPLARHGGVHSGQAALNRSSVLRLPSARKYPAPNGGLNAEADDKLSSVQ